VTEPALVDCCAPWRTWCLGAWIALVLAVAVGAAAERPAPSVAATEAIADAPAPGQAPEPTPPRPSVPTTPSTSPAIVAAPVAVTAPAIGLQAELLPVGKTPDGAVDVPDFGTAGWYEPGPRPGQAGGAVLVGHVDSRTGPDVFFGLDRLQQGDAVDVRRADGTSAAFVVTRVEETDKDDLPVDRVFGPVDGVELRLITCGGAFDRSSGSYESNVIVYAVAA
jgi:sortase (surface protein transpeptidase)